MITQTARRLRQKLNLLSDTLVEQLRQAQLPGLSIFAQPVLKQSARQLYTALLDSLETGDSQLLMDSAIQQAQVRTQQGVSASELGQIARMFVAAAYQITDHECRDDPTSHTEISTALDALLQAFAQAFVGDAQIVQDLVQKHQSQLGGEMKSLQSEKNDPGDTSTPSQVLRQLQTSIQVSRQLSASLDLSDLLLQVVELIRSNFNYYHVHVYLTDSESDCLMMREGSGQVGAQLKARGHRIPLGKGLVGQVGQDGKPVLVGDVRQNPQWLPNPLLPDTRSELAVPLKLGERILGVLDVQSDQVNGVTEADLALMESLGLQVAVAVENAILFRETRAISIISRAVSSGLGRGQVFAAVSRELKAVVPFDYMTIATYYEITGQVEIEGIDDRTDADIPLEEGVQLPVDLCIPGMAIRQKRPIIAPDLTAEAFGSLIDAEILRKRGMRSMLSVPLIAQGQVGGAINLASAQERAFTAADIHLMDQVSGQLATALANARIFENIQQMVAERTSETALFRAMAEMTSEGVALTNVQQVITYANPAFYRIHGYDPQSEDLPRRPLTAFMDTDHASTLSDDIRDQVLQGHEWHVEMHHRRRDGNRFVASTTVFGIRDEHDELIALAATVRDISAQRKIMTIIQAASSTPDLDRLAPLLLQEIAANTDIDRSIMILYDKITEDGPQNMSLVAVYDPSSGGRRSLSEKLTIQESPFSALVYYERAPIFVSDVRTDERLSENGRQLLISHGVYSFLALPIWVRNKIVGMVSMDWRKHIELDDAEISLYQTMVNQISTAVENARLIAEQQREMEQILDRRVREAATSIEVGQAIAAAPELNDLFGRVVTLIKERFGYYHAHVYRMSVDQQELVLAAGYGDAGRIMVERGHRIPLGKGLNSAAVLTRKPVRVSNVNQDPQWLPNPLLPYTQSELAVPILLGDQVLGVLDVQSDRLNGLTEDDEILLLGLCGQIASAIRNVELVEQLYQSREAAQQRAQQLELSAGVSEQLASELVLEDLLARIVFLIQQGFDYYHVFIYLTDPQTGHLTLKEGTGEAGMIMKERQHQIALGHGLVGQSAQLGVTILAPDVTQHPGWASNPLLPNTRSEIAVPLKLGDRVLGVLDVQDDRLNGLNEESQALLEGLGGQLAVAIQNALNFRNIESQVAQRAGEARRFQSLVENAAEAIFIADLQGKIVFANQASYDLYGYNHVNHEMIGLSLSRLWPITAQATMEQATAQSMVSSWRGQVTQVRQNYSQVIVDLTMFGVRDEQGNLTAIAVLARDMTVENLVSHLNQAISSISSLDQLGVELLQHALDSAQADRGYFVAYEGDDEECPGTARLLASFDEDAPTVVSVDKPNDFKKNLIHQIIYNTQAPLIYNGEPDADPQLIQISQQLQSRVFAAFPIIVEQCVACMLLLDRFTDMPFAAQEIDLLTNVLTQVSSSIANMILRERQRQEMQHELERRTQEMFTTTQVAQAIASAPDLRELYRLVVTLVKERFRYYHVHMYELSADQQELVLVSGYGEPGRIMVERGHRIKLGKGINSTAVLTKRAVLVPDVRQDPNWLPNQLLPDTRSELAVPIMMGDEVLGVLDVQQNTINGLTLADQSLMINLCGQIATAIQNTRLLQRTQASLRRTDLLLKLSTALSALTDPQSLADALAGQLMSIASIERCLVILFGNYDAQSIPHQAEVYTVQERESSFAGGMQPHTVFSLDEHPILVNQLIQHRQTLVIDDLPHDEQLSPHERAIIKAEGAASFVAVPMLTRERVLGCFMLIDRQHYEFAEADLELYLGVANQGAVAFSNALSLSQVREALQDASRLYESSRAIALSTTLDVLTGNMIKQIVDTHIDRCEIMLYEQRGSRKMVTGAGGWANQTPIPPGGSRRIGDCPLCSLVDKIQGSQAGMFTEADLPLLSAPLQAMFNERQIRALALVPLVAAEERIGFIFIERHISNSFNPDALRLYETIAGQSAVALRNMQLIEQSQRQLEELQTSYNETSRLADTVRQLSSPVIQIWQDVLVLPLVGAIDSRRAARIMEDLLNGITRFQAEQVIIDVTGVPVLDEAVANHLIQTIKAATLLGARCMLVGINSEKAQTIVSLGLNWRGIRTFSNLRAGIQAALQELGFAIMPHSPTEGEETV